MDLETIIRAVGYTGIFGIVFAESGLLLGFFLPGDSLLFTSGFLASQNFFNIQVLVVGFIIAAIIGDSFGYMFGKRVGKKLFNKEDSLLFDKKHILKAQAFYEKHGGKTIILARFMPFIRTFAPIVAGIGDMHYPKFLAYNILGGVLWGAGITLGGYFLGKSIPDVDKYLLPIIAVIIIVSVSPSLIHLLKDKEQRTKLSQIIRKGVTYIRYKLSRNAN